MSKNRDGRQRNHWHEHFQTPPSIPTGLALPVPVVGEEIETAQDLSEHVQKAEVCRQRSQGELLWPV